MIIPASRLWELKPDGTWVFLGEVDSLEITFVNPTRPESLDDPIFGSPPRA